MQHIFRFIIGLILICLGHAAIATPTATVLAAKSKPVAIDSRIKTYIYSENEVFKLVVHYGYQTSIEFAEGEEIQTISTGNSYAWQITPVGRRLFIKPLEENIATNMTILTNKRPYHFDIESRALAYDLNEELVYVVRFFFPETDLDIMRPQVVAVEQEPLPPVKPFNFSYTMKGPEKIAPVKIFDDGVNTFFKFRPSVTKFPKFILVRNGVDELQIPRKKGDYIVLNSVGTEYKLLYDGNQIINVYNEKPSYSGS